MSIARPTANQIFTPRRAEVNNDMYIHRNSHEKSLKRWLDEDLHGFIFGESGNGKSWLYKKVFSEKKINFVVANCSLAATKGSIRNEIYSTCIPSGTPTKTSYTELKEAGIGAGILNAGISHEATYELQPEDKLITAFKELAIQSTSNNYSVIVLDNVEAIFNSQELMDELAEIVLLLDDSRYATYKVKFLIVGVPCGVIEYFSKSKNRSSVGNRISELPAINGFTLEETIEIVDRGFNKHLLCELSEKVTEGIAGRVYDITLGIPQRVHEYCLCLYYELEDNNWDINQRVFENADFEWLQKGLRESYSTIEEHFSGGEGQTRRRQVLYAIGQARIHQFTTANIGSTIRKQFPDEDIMADSGIGSILSSLTKGDSPLLSKNKITGYFSVTDPRHIMCLRVALEKKDNGHVIKKGFIIR